MPDLSLFVEFGVGLAGFSAVVVAFTTGNGELNQFDRFRVIMLLLNALIPPFVAALVPVLASFEVPDPVALKVLGYVTLIGMISVLLAPIVMLRSMTEEARAQLHIAIWIFGNGGTAIFAIWNFVNLMEWFGPMSAGPIALSLVWTLILAALMLLRMLLVRVRVQTAETAGENDQ